MAILDQYGQSVRSSRYFAESSNNYSEDRPYYHRRLDDINKLVGQYDRETLISVSRRLFVNMGLARGAITDKAKYSVGRGWDVIFTGKDKKWGEMVQKLLTEQWFKTCDVRGMNFDWKTLLYLDSIALDRDGDFGIILSETDQGWPQMQRIGAHRIKGEGEVKSGVYEGLKMRNGVIRSDVGRPMAFNVVSDEGQEDRIIDQSNMILTFDPDWHEQERGQPAFTHSLNDMRDMLQSQQWEQIAMLILSSVSMIEYNDSGETEDDSKLLDGVTPEEQAAEIATNSFFGGMVRHFKAGSGNKLETISSDRPSDVWDRFQDRLTRSALVGIGMPYSLVWKPSGQSTAERSDLEKAARTIEDRQDVIRGYAHRLINWAVSKLIQSGRIPMSSNAEDWYAWDFTMPPKISINFKNDTQALLALNSRGLVNDSDIVGFFGKNLDNHYRQRAYQIALRKRITREVSKETGEEITERDMKMHTPNDMEDQEPEKEISEDDKK